MLMRSAYPLHVNSVRRMYNSMAVRGLSLAYGVRAVSNEPPELGV
jgi:hypothetical protein